jgi:hypothetical protein
LPWASQSRNKVRIARKRISRRVSKWVLFATQIF